MQFFFLFLSEMKCDGEIYFVLPGWQFRAGIQELVVGAMQSFLFLVAV
jgi:hypothetical protein